MSDATDDLDIWDRKLLRESRSNPLRAKMREFVAEMEPPAEVTELRRRIGDGADLSKLVDEGRDERV